ncbi:transcription factor Adf-1-like [Cimex lectularius]|uniref:Transcription factor Adf-1 n=1 Tax=Cimex lectularius TaxID=79782 RepID=A0A8I6RJH4_CIMLE|nr:transcription factor Adf-1-like [Cimex lectularius]
MSQLNDIDSTFALVDAVKKYPILYDTTDVDYHVKHKHDIAWKEVAKEVNAPATSCKEKWKNLRAAYSRHRRQQIAYEMGGKPRKPYYLAEYMSFLIPHSNVKPVNRINFGIASNNSDRESQDDQEACVDIKEERTEEWSNSAEEDEPSKFVTTDIFETDFSTSILESGEKKTSEELKKKDRTERCCFTSGQNDDDADLNFLKSLLPDMRQMKQRKKNQFKIAVLKTLEDFIEY